MKAITMNDMIVKARKAISYMSFDEQEMLKRVFSGLGNPFEENLIRAMTRVENCGADVNDAQEVLAEFLLLSSHFTNVRKSLKWLM